MSFFENTRKPAGFGGKAMVSMMNIGHRTLASWGLQFLTLAPDAKILDCGCGGGANIKDMDKLFTDITNIKVNTCEEPDETVVRGLSLVVTNDKFKRLAYSMRTKIFK